MARLYDERIRFSETMFARGEERLFLARRQGVTALAAWVSRALNHDAVTTQLYDLDLTAAFAKGADDTALLRRIAATFQAEGIAFAIDEARAVLARGSL